MKRMLNGPGASTRGAGVGAMLVEAQKKLDFDVATSVSYSSLAMVPTVLGEHDLVLDESVHIDPQEAFEKRPIGDNGKPTANAIWRVIWGIMRSRWIEESDKYCSFGIQNVKPMLRRLVPKSMFNKYQDGDYPRIFIVACNRRTRKAEAFNIKDKKYDYETYLKIVSASARIPIMTQPEKIGNDYYYDGGMTDTNAGMFVLENELIGETFDEIVSVYPRTEDISNQPPPPPLKNILTEIDWAISVWIHTVTRDDAKIEREVCFRKKIKLLQMFCRLPTDNLYDMNYDNLIALQNDSIDVAKEKLKEFMS